jgi:hypothetical protein
MDCLLTSSPGITKSIITTHGSTMQAIRECYEIAKAWDALMEHGTWKAPADAPHSWEEVRDWMRRLLPVYEIPWRN